MTQNTLPETSDGYVNIRDGAPGSSGGNHGFFSIGGGGGFGGGFGGTSRKRAKKRARRRAAALAQARAQAEAQAQALAQAQEQARQAAAVAQAAAHRQQVDAFGQAREARRAQLDAHFAGQLQGLTHALQNEIDRAKTSPRSSPSERWQLYLISKAQAEVNGLIAAKQSELGRQQALAAAFAGSDMPAEAYTARLATLTDLAQMHQLYAEWHAAYAASAEAALLQEAIRQLQERSAQLASQHAEQTVIWQAREAEWERQRLYAEQREARIRHKQQADEDRRIEHLKQAATFTTPAAAVSSGGALFTQAGVQVAADLASTLERFIVEAVSELLRIAKQGPNPIALAIKVAVYSPALGNGELTAAQRQQRL